MVQLEEVEDPELDSAQPGPAPEYDSADDYEDTGTTHSHSQLHEASTAQLPAPYSYR